MPSSEPRDAGRHVHPETLSLLALGERAASVPESEHVSGCARCQSDLDELTAVVRTGRTVTTQDAPQQPSAQVWDRIQAELRAADPRRATSLAAPPVREAPRLLRRPPRRAVAMLVAAGLAGVLTGVGGTLLAQRMDRDPAAAVASGRLQPLAMKDASGEAAVTGPPADRRLTLSVTGMPARPQGGGFYEVWLLDRSAKRLVALGLLGPGESGSFQLPPDLDLSRYPLVDVSVEPDDGNPAHSGVSAVRGDLRL